MVAPAYFTSSTSLSGKPATDGRVLEMKIRLANKILKHQPENDPIGYRYNQYWVKRWEEEKKARKREYARKWYAEHKDLPEFKAKRKVYRDKFYKKHPEEVKAYSRKNYAEHHDQKIAYTRRYYAAHKDKIVAYAKKWREANREKQRAYNRKYAKAKYHERKQQAREYKKAVTVESLPPADKIATIFKNPAAAEHYKWLMQKRGVIKQESEVEHEVAS